MARSERTIVCQKCGARFHPVLDLSRIRFEGCAACGSRRLYGVNVDTATTAVPKPDPRPEDQVTSPAPVERTPKNWERYDKDDPRRLSDRDMLRARKIVLEALA